MTASSLSLEGFQDLIDRFGGDILSWPARDRTAAEMLIAQSPTAERLLDEARKLDAQLAQMPKAPADLADRIVDAALHSPPRRKT